MILQNSFHVRLRWTTILLFLLNSKSCRMQDAEFWRQQAQKNLNTILGKKHNTNVAKNVIFFLGDGMGVSTVTAARIYGGQKVNKSGEENILSFEAFPEIGLVKTYNTDQQVPDSAGTGTAFLCGVKSKAGTLGLDDHVMYSNCSSQRGAEVTSILDWSTTEGKSTGIVTTARITHATPAAAYAHAARRGWEGDTEMPSDAQECKDIAYQLVMENAHIHVLMGGGRRYFLSQNKSDPELNSVSRYHRHDVDLIDEWISEKQNRNVPHRYIWNKKQFEDTDPESTDYLLGLFESSHMSYEYARDRSDAGEPSLREMTEKAIQILSKNQKGYFLLVEGGRIDHAHHGTRAARALEETVAFDAAVASAVSMTNQEDTLIVVTADHSHVFMMAGYPSRGNDILGKVDGSQGDDGLPYTTLVYGNGYEQRKNITEIDTTDFSYRQESLVPMNSETHGGEDVPVYARGPMAHLFVGTHEQNYLPHAMAYASCVGVNKAHCTRRPSNEGLSSSTASLGQFDALVITVPFIVYYRISGQRYHFI